MFTNDDPACLAACTAMAAAETSPTYNETFVESFLTSFINMLTEDARRIFWHVMDDIDPTDPHRLVYATEMLRAMRHADRCGVSASDIIAEFGSVAAINFERLLFWLIEQHGHVLAGSEEGV